MRRFKHHSISHGPGPPQRLQIPGESDELDLAEAELTAKRLSVRAVLVEPQLGHSIFWPEDIERTSFSNRASHCAQVYS